MKEFLEKLFSPGFMPHGYCYLWNPGLVWLHVVSDALIALAYFSIPVTLIYFIRKRRDLPFHWMFVSFGIFTPRTQKITSNLNARLGLSGGPGIADDTLSNLDVCLLRLYLYVICLAPVPLNGRNASIDPESCFSAVRHFPKRFNGSRRHVPCLPVRRIAISSRLSA